MGKLFIEYLNGHGILACSTCQAHLTSNDQIISKSFFGAHGQAYLINNVVNIVTGPSESRLMRTGLHIVTDVQCKQCFQLIGWKYEKAFEEAQKYKEGKFVLERQLIVQEDEDEDEDDENDDNN